MVDAPSSFKRVQVKEKCRDQEKQQIFKLNSHGPSLVSPQSLCNQSFWWCFCVVTFSFFSVIVVAFCHRNE